MGFLSYLIYLRRDVEIVILKQSTIIQHQGTISAAYVWFLYVVIFTSRMSTAMPSSYISLWSADRYKLLSKYKQTGQPLEVLFGGPHSSMPSFGKYGVSPGDYIYPVRVHQGTMYILGCMRVKVVQPIEDYVLERPETFGGCDASTAARILTG